jgi:16S rRNA processing protein RimM
MKILNDNCLLIGEFIKTHGVNGEILLKFDNSISEDFTIPEYIFIEIDGSPVPFFLNKGKFTMRSNTTAILKLDEIDSDTTAQELLSLKIYAPSGTLDMVESPKPVSKQIIGFRVIDKDYGEIGNVANVLEFQSNSVLQIKKDAKEILIPIHENIINNIDVEKRIIEIDAPEGLIDIYM